MKYLEKAKGFLRVTRVCGRRLAGKAWRRAGRFAGKLEAKLPAWALQEGAALREEGAALFQWRRWCLVQWLTTGACALLALYLLFKPEPFPSSRELFLLKALGVGATIPWALLLHSFACRATASTTLRSLSGGMVFYVFYLSSLVLVSLLTTDRWSREYLVHVCITEPSRACVDFARRRPAMVNSFPDETRAEIWRYVQGREGKRLYEDLSQRNQAFVRETYKELLAAQEKKDFQAMFDKARIILTLVDDYNDTKSYEAISKRGLDQIEEEKRRRALEEKQRFVREEVAKLEEKARLLGVTQEPQQRLELKALIGEIFQRDPNNRVAAELKSQLEARVAEEKRIASAKEVTRLLAEGRKSFPRALRSPAARPELKRIVAEIHRIDPAHRQATEWQVNLALEEVKEHEARIRQEAAHVRLRVAELEIRGERLLGPAHRDAKARAELYEVMERLSELDRANPYPGSWRRTLQKHLQ